MKIFGIGTDVVDIRRFGDMVEKRGQKILSKIFTENEIAYAAEKKFSVQHMAGKFSAKEAVKKALPDGAKIGLRWTEIEILNHEDGKPHVKLYGTAAEIMCDLGITEVMVSVSHTESIATSNAMAVKNG